MSVEFNPPSQANAKIRTFYNNFFEKSGGISSSFTELQQTKQSLAEDINTLKSDTHAQIEHVLNLLNHHQKTMGRTSLTNSKRTSKSSSSTQTSEINQDDCGRALKTIQNKNENIDDLRAAHTKELFEAKVKLKEMEAKLAHFHKKVKDVIFNADWKPGGTRKSLLVPLVRQCFQDLLICYCLDLSSFPR